MDTINQSAGIDLHRLLWRRRQADIPTRVGRNFLRDVLDDACAAITAVQHMTFAAAGLATKDLKARLSNVAAKAASDAVGRALNDAGMDKSSKAAAQYAWGFVIEILEGLRSPKLSPR